MISWGIDAREEVCWGWRGPEGWQRRRHRWWGRPTWAAGAPTSPPTTRTPGPQPSFPPSRRQLKFTLNIEILEWKWECNFWLKSNFAQLDLGLCPRPDDNWNFCWTLGFWNESESETFGWNRILPNLIWVVRLADRLVETSKMIKSGRSQLLRKFCLAAQCFQNFFISWVIYAFSAP